MAVFKIHWPERLQLTERHELYHDSHKPSQGFDLLVFPHQRQSGETLNILQHVTKHSQEENQKGASKKCEWERGREGGGGRTGRGEDKNRYQRQHYILLSYLLFAYPRFSSRFLCLFPSFSLPKRKKWEKKKNKSKFLLALFLELL